MVFLFKKSHFAGSMQKPKEKHTCFESDPKCHCFFSSLAKDTIMFTVVSEKVVFLPCIGIHSKGLSHSYHFRSWQTFQNL